MEYEFGYSNRSSFWQSKNLDILEFCIASRALLHSIPGSVFISRYLATYEFMIAKGSITSCSIIPVSRCSASIVIIPDVRWADQSHLLTQ